MVYIAGVRGNIDTGDTYFTEISKLPISGSVEAKRKLQRNILKNLDISGSKPLEARIEHSRYVVDCPNCNSAEFAFEDNLFLCSMCNNSDIGGKLRKVKMPKDRKEIEAILSKRQIKNRHWIPSQTIKDLENENIIHALEVV